MIDQLTTHCHQRLRALFCIREDLGKSSLVIAYKFFVRPKCKYGNVILWVLLLCTYASWMQYKRYVAETLCQITFQSLLFHCQASAHPHHLQYVTDDPLLLQSFVKYNSLDLFLNNFHCLVNHSTELLAICNSIVITLK